MTHRFGTSSTNRPAKVSPFAWVQRTLDVCVEDRCVCHVLTEREEKASIAVASKLSFSEWGQIIIDARLVSAVIDRVTFNAHILETGTDSYRHRTSRTRTRTRTRKSA